ncbi:GIY-YIG nuclease family protein [Fodinibius saliphilus]|uniref:GIY-YIG nuclease family protein n=1 Tax=Fodinibius saliphilus TaxID=1920650 RepID=UPI001108B659|nr:GIY-YIG nuclease family protein [Fodinibius saliphilus]
MDSWFVYMIRCFNGNLYTGSTNHLVRRWHKHKEGKGAKYLRSNEPKAVVYVEEHSNRSEACKREYEIKQFSKEEKELLVSNVAAPD